MAGNAGPVVTLLEAMFAREYLSVVSRWARDQLRQETQTAASRRHLKRLIEAADALSKELAPDIDAPPNVVRLADHKRAASLARLRRTPSAISFLDI